ncbi:Ig-like domain-containing protein [Candidatus Palauibacter sp.]|uniref:Ig-like domain-containing protein n=1 Tax=Candidatus Palauibacter sp. TaxID=3101350 RepID=UPI003B5C30D9
MALWTSARGRPLFTPVVSHTRLHREILAAAEARLAEAAEWIRRAAPAPAPDNIVFGSRIRLPCIAVLALAAACGGDDESSPLVPQPSTPATITLSPATATLTSLGETVELTATVRDRDGASLTGVTIRWASSDVAVATVTDEGLVTAVRNGVAAVTASAGGVTGNAAVTVEQRAAAVIVTPAADTLAVGDTLRLSAVATDGNGHPVATAQFAWSSDDTTVARVDSTGLVTAAGSGMTTIAVSAGSASASAAITVEQEVSAVTVTPVADTLVVGDTLRLSAVATDSNGRPLATAQFAWSSSDSSVARVDTSGLVQAIGVGVAVISAAAGSAEGTSEITVTASPDRAALVALYEATDGPNWAHNDNWLTDAPLGQWHGVAVDRQGRVTALSMRLNDLNGPIPVELGNLSRLEVLSITNSKLRSPGFTGSIPGALGQLSQLRLVNLNSNSLRGPIPPELGNLSSLENLFLPYNYLEGSIPAELGELDNLIQLELQGNKLTGSIPPELGNLAKLTSLWLFRNGLGGSIPGTLGNLSRLDGLGLSENALTGAIPAELGKLSQLERLWLQNNQLDSIPPELGSLSRLAALLLHDNKLKGSIPAALGDLSAVTDFFLFNNDLSGPLPPELGNLPMVERLWLSGNQLEGGVPEAFGGLASLRELDLTNNPRMSGALPNSLTALSGLGALLAGGTGLCAPHEAGFLAWLGGVFKQRVRLCEAEGAAMAYLAQAVQSREFPVPLVAGEEALLRVFVTASSAGGAGIPPVRASFYLDGAEAHVVDIPAQSTPIPAAVDEGDLDASANARVPGEVVQPGLEMVIEIDPEGTLDPAVEVTRRIPEEGREAVDVREMPTLALTLVPFLWSENPDSAIVDITMDMADDPGNHELLRYTRTVLPVGGLGVETHEPVLTSTNNGFELHGEVKAIRVMEGGSGHYMGLMSGSVTGPAGIAGAPGWTSFSVLNSSTMAHELGHNMSLSHAPGCGAGGPDPAFPTSDGAIGVWGYDLGDEVRLVAPRTFDLMSYCSSRWISAYHFGNALRYRRFAAETGAANSMAVPGGTLLLWGVVDDRGKPSLEPAFLLDSPPTLPASGSEYEITGRTAAGDALFSFRFDMTEVADGDGSSSFAFAVPAQPDWANELHSITLSGPGGSDTLDVDTDRPAVILRDPVTGRVRGILRDHHSLAAARGDLDILFSRGIPRPTAPRR